MEGFVLHQVISEYLVNAGSYDPIFFTLTLNSGDIFKWCVYSGAPQLHRNEETLGDIKTSNEINYVFRNSLLQLLNNFHFMYIENIDLKGGLISS